MDSATYRVPVPIRESVGLSVLWIGHASVLIQIHDKVFVTDPVFTNTTGLLARRSIEAGLDPSVLTRVDFTLISHLHFDHFNYGSIGMLPKNGRLILPPGGAEYTPEFGFTETAELQTWESLERDGVRITAVPVQHFGGRYGFDIAWMPNRGYTGYVVEYRGKTVFIAGDTGYRSEFFREIGRRFPDIDLALIPIAPIHPRSFMSPVHADPDEALQIFEDTRAKIMVPIHYEAFFQGMDPTRTYAKELLKESITAHHLEASVWILDAGEQREVK